MDEAIVVMISGCRAALSGSVLFGAPQTNCEDLAQILDKILDSLRRRHFDQICKGPQVRRYQVYNVGQLCTTQQASCMHLPNRYQCLSTAWPLNLVYSSGAQVLPFAWKVFMMPCEPRAYFSVICARESAEEN
jgi:hypothetical protein